jgi:hypothetical protein
MHGKTTATSGPSSVLAFARARLPQFALRGRRRLWSIADLIREVPKKEVLIDGKAGRLESAATLNCRLRARNSIGMTLPRWVTLTCRASFAHGRKTPATWLLAFDAEGRSRRRSLTTRQCARN